jgi:hypothetical protein
MSRLQHTTVYLDEHRLQGLKQFAAREQQSVAFLVRRAIDELLS